MVLAIPQSETACQPGLARQRVESEELRIFEDQFFTTPARVVPSATIRRGQ
jgi:hypothetical protein